MCFVSLVLVIILNELQKYLGNWKNSDCTAWFHKNLINRVRNGLANIGKTVKLVFMDSNYYEQWLSVNDFEDSPDIRIFWGSEQIKNISKSWTGQFITKIRIVFLTFSQLITPTNLRWVCIIHHRENLAALEV